MKKSKRKRYADSIMPHLYTPYGDIVRHEVFCANAEEEALSRAYGLWIWVTPQRDNILRDAPDCISNVMYREDAQRAFEALYGRDEFIPPSTPRASTGFSSTSRRFPRASAARQLTEAELDELEMLRKRNEYLEAENALLKKVRALVEEREARLRAIGQKPSKD